MAYTEITRFKLTDSWVYTPPSIKNFFRVRSLTPVERIPKRLAKGKVEIAQVSPEGDLYANQSIKYEAEGQLLFFPLPEFWENQRLAFRLSSAAYSAWDIAVDECSEILSLPAQLVHSTLEVISMLIHDSSVQPPNLTTLSPTASILTPSVTNASAVAVPANPSRVGLEARNNGTGTIFLEYGAAATNTSLIRLTPGQTFTMTTAYTGAIHALGTLAAGQPLAVREFLSA